jgi:Putative polyhydroxyalkanoic acid system protein (PHA_gran_rgn)
MPSYQVVVPHQLGRAVARNRVEEFLVLVERQYAAQISNVEGTWTADELQFRLSASGLAISGAMRVEESVVQVSGPLPLAAALFRGRLEQTIRTELQKLLAS